MSRRPSKEQAPSVGEIDLGLIPSASDSIESDKENW